MVWKTLDNEGHTLFGNVLSDITVYLVDSFKGVLITESITLVGNITMPTSKVFEMGNWCLA